MKEKDKFQGCKNKKKTTQRFLSKNSLGETEHVLGRRQWFDYRDKYFYC